MQRKGKEFLQTLQVGDFVVLKSGKIKKRMIVFEIRGNIIEVAHLKLGKPQMEFLKESGFPERFLNQYYSKITGGIVDLSLGFDGTEPDLNHEFYKCYSILLGVLTVINKKVALITCP